MTDAETIENLCRQITDLQNTVIDAVAQRDAARDSHAHSSVASVDPADIWERYCAETPREGRSPQGAMAFAVDALTGAPAQSAGMREALRELLDHVDRNTCTHEQTSRGGVIWTICDGCGMKWADDGGGFKPHKDAPAVAKARAALASQPSPAATVDEKRARWCEANNISYDDPTAGPPVARLSAVTAQEHLQSRGRHYDIIREAIAAYDEFMLDDDYDAQRTLDKIIKKMRERVDMTDAPVDLTNHHNALKCPYCNPKGLQFVDVPQATLTREDKLENERNELQNSYGQGSFKDGALTRRIAEIDKELASLALSRPLSGGENGT